MESINVYHTTFMAACPNNGIQISYDYTIETQAMILVEDIIEEVRGIDAGYHEAIADRLYRRFEGRQTLVAHHHGVDIRTLRTETGHTTLLAA